jgi:hypothetical protein
MCNTPWCDGSCEECVAEKKRQQDYEDSIAQCPYRKECKWVTVDIKNDRCTTCGKTFRYP